jgi:hypothetical protein
MWIFRRRIPAPRLHESEYFGERRARSGERFVVLRENTDGSLSSGGASIWIDVLTEDGERTIVYSVRSFTVICSPPVGWTP